MVAWGFPGCGQLHETGRPDGREDGLSSIAVGQRAATRLMWWLRDNLLVILEIWLSQRINLGQKDPQDASGRFAVG